MESSWDTGILTALVAVLNISAAVLASGHAILRKRDSRAAVAWVGVIWLAPLVGSLLYVLLGINRITSKATDLRAERLEVHPDADLSHYTPDALEQFVPEALKPLSRLVNRVSRQMLLGGNRIEPLVNGDQAYPRMLAAIEAAQTSVTLSTYIFNNDTSGREFAQALGDAVARGVHVRVLVDAFGARYSFPSIEWRLRRRKIPFALFIPTRVPTAIPFVNLRNHRKILIVDGVLGFAGGMNIAHSNCLHALPRSPVQDLHFEVEGPIVTELQTVFAEDWAFARREVLSGPVWFPTPVTPGTTLARVLQDGPDESYDTLRQILMGALSVARERVCIMTPYFLPDATLQDTLASAALRGVRVDVVLPAKNNLRLVDWASRVQIEDLLRWGVRVWFSPPPFDHSKLFTVDNEWALIGSANWDQRSLLLNFECNIECYDAWLTSRLNAHFDATRARSRRVTRQELEQQSLWRRLRNGMARLLSPYL